VTDQTVSPSSWAHSRNPAGRRHLLEDHHRVTARLARGFANDFGAGDLAYYAALWHDVGKFINPAFQDYLFRCEQDPLAGGHGPDHKSAGAQLALKSTPSLALLVQGHHGGLKTPNHLRAWMAQRASDPAPDDAMARAQRALPDLQPDGQLELPKRVKDDEISSEMFLRMVFSCLVDADYLDTEGHFSHGRTEMRGSNLTLGDLWERFERNQAAFVSDTRGTVNRIRREAGEVDRPAQRFDY